MSVPNSTPLLGDYRYSTLQIVCNRCRRDEEHGVPMLRRFFGSEISLQELLPLTTASCERREACEAYVPVLVETPE
jgi:hypothetical protein